jgi:hypothetical protein
MLVLLIDKYAIKYLKSDYTMVHRVFSLRQSNTFLLCFLLRQEAGTTSQASLVTVK